MSVYIEKLQGKTTFWLVALFVISGLVLRSLPDGEQQNTATDADTRTMLRVTQFLAENNMPSVRRVHYTKDSGIRGLQIKLPRCRGNMQITIMPEGDEFLNLWEARAVSVDYTTTYLFNRNIYPDFPLYTFWWKTMSHALARRLRIIDSTNPGPVLALAYPVDCPLLQQVPWQNF